MSLTQSSTSELTKPLSRLFSILSMPRISLVLVSPGRILFAGHDEPQRNLSTSPMITVFSSN